MDTKCSDLKPRFSCTSTSLNVYHLHHFYMYTTFSSTEGNKKTTGLVQTQPHSERALHHNAEIIREPEYTKIWTHYKSSICLEDPGKDRGCSTNNVIIHWVTNLFCGRGLDFMNFLCLPDRLICQSRINQAERFAWFAWAGLIRLGRGAWFAWAGLIRLRRLPDLHKQDILSCSENQVIRQAT